jgi:hypothetical protein
MNSRTKIITEQVLLLEDQDEALSDEAEQFLQEAWDKGIASGPSKYASIEDIIGEARRSLSSEAT